MLVKDDSGKPVKVLKVASDITTSKIDAASNSSMIAGIERAMAVIEFTPDVTILTANENFLHLCGYALSEITGKHHSMLLDPLDARSEEYVDHWRRLQAGECVQGRFKRITKAGDELWLQATYTPILNP